MYCKVTLIAAISIGLIFPNYVLADFACSTEIKYRWQKEEKKESTVFWAVLEKRGATELEAKTGLTEASNRERSRALQACQKEHQNSSGCIASRLESSQAVMTRLSFTARKKLEESIVDDCSLKQGQCIAVDVSEPVCVDLNPVPVEDEATKEDGKKGKKK